jgi:hypothetical protein
VTPEGRVKNKVRAVLNHYAPGVWWYMPVGNGMGKPTLDFMGCAWGQFFSIETKAPGGKPTPRQEGTIARMQDAKGKTFVIDGDTTELETWLLLHAGSQK